MKKPYESFSLPQLWVRTKDEGVYLVVEGDTPMMDDPQHKSVTIWNAREHEYTALHYFINSAQEIGLRVSIFRTKQRSNEVYAMLPTQLYRHVGFHMSGNPERVFIRHDARLRRLEREKIDAEIAAEKQEKQHCQEVWGSAMTVKLGDIAHLHVEQS